MHPAPYLAHPTFKLATARLYVATQSHSHLMEENLLPFSLPPSNISCVFLLSLTSYEGDLFLYGGGHGGDGGGHPNASEVHALHGNQNRRLCGDLNGMMSS